LIDGLLVLSPDCGAQHKPRQKYRNVVEKFRRVKKKAQALPRRHEDHGEKQKKPDVFLRGSFSRSLYLRGEF
jgi:hypothetical protein